MAQGDPWGFLDEHAPTATKAPQGDWSFLDEHEPPDTSGFQIGLPVEIHPDAAQPDINQPEIQPEMTAPTTDELAAGAKKFFKGRRGAGALETAQQFGAKGLEALKGTTKSMVHGAEVLGSLVVPPDLDLGPRSAAGGSPEEQRKMAEMIAANQKSGPLISEVPGFAERATPTEKFIAEEGGPLVGSTIPYAAGGAALAPFGPVGVAMGGGAMGASQSAGDMYDRVLEQTKDPEKAMKAALLSTPGGALTGSLSATAVGRLPIINKLTGGLAGKLLLDAGTLGLGAGTQGALDAVIRNKLAGEDLDVWDEAWGAAQRGFKAGAVLSGAGMAGRAILGGSEGKVPTEPGGAPARPGEKPPPAVQERPTSGGPAEGSPLAGEASVPREAPTGEPGETTTVELPRRAVERAGQPERRQNTEQRQTIDEQVQAAKLRAHQKRAAGDELGAMAEMEGALEAQAGARKTDKMTGLPNKEAFEEAPRGKGVESGGDMNGLGWMNDKMGHEVGNQALTAVGHAFRDVAAEYNATAEPGKEWTPYHVHGDEFPSHGPSVEVNERLHQEVNSRLKDVEISGKIIDPKDPNFGKTVKFRGLSVAWGHGEHGSGVEGQKDYYSPKAEEGLVASKAAQEQAGIRSKKGTPPPGAVFEGSETAAPPAPESARPAEAAPEELPEGAKRIVYHGTPHEFEKFDTSKIGTGEGAQAFGHGLYFTSKKEIAEHYAEKLSSLQKGPREPLKKDFEATEHQIEQIRKHQLEPLAPNSSLRPAIEKNIARLEEQAKSERAAYEKAKGQVHEVALAPKEHELLDLDKPVSEQSPQVQAALKKLGVAGAEGDASYTGKRALDALTKTYNASPKEAARVLQENGVRGTKYLEGQSRPTAGGKIIGVEKGADGWKAKIRTPNRLGSFGEETTQFTTSKPFQTEAEARAWAEKATERGQHNFVIFSDKDVEILKPGGEPAPAAEPPKGPEAAAAAEPAPEPELTSTKKAVMEEERAARGADPLEDAIRKTRPESFDRAKAAMEADPSLGDRVIKGEETKDLTADEREAVLGREKVANRNEKDRIEEALIKAQESGDETMAKALRGQAEVAEARADEIDRATKREGVEWARQGGVRQMLIDRDYGIHAVERSLRAAKGGPLTEGERAEVKELHGKLAEAEKALAEHHTRRRELEAENAVLKLKAKAKGPAKKQRFMDILDARAEKARERLRGKLGRAGGGLAVDPGDIAALADIAASHLAHGIDAAAKLVHDFGEWVKPHLEAVIAKARSLHLDAASEETVASIKERLAGGGTLKDARADVQKLSEAFVRGGVKDRNELVDKVHDVLKKADPAITRREAMDAISGYGDFKPLNPDEIKAKLRDLKGQLQQVAKLEDMEKHLRAPKKTGVEQREPSSEERLLIKQVNEARKRLGIKTTDPATQLKSALDSIKTRLTNQIESLDRQIKTRTPDKIGNVVPPSDAESKKLAAKRDELKAQLDEIASAQKVPGPTPAEAEARQAKAALKALNRQIEALEADVKSGSPIKEPDVKAPKPTSPEIEKARARLDVLREQRNYLRLLQDPQRSPEEVGLQAYKIRKARQLADLQERLVAGDVEPRKKGQPFFALDSEANRLQTDVEAAKQKIQRALARKRFENRTTGQKARDVAREALNLPKQIMTGFDMSATLFQGGIQSATHPIISAKALKESVRALVSERKSLEVDTALRNRPNAADGEKAGLELTSLDGPLSAHEEHMRSSWAGKIPIIGKGVEASNRAFTTFLNVQRALTFDKLTEAMPDKSPEAKNAVANFINVSTGRGYTPAKFKAAMSAAANVLWSPRLMVSRFQLLAGQPLYRGTASSRMAIAGEYAKALGALGAVYAVSALAGNDVEKDPRSSNFGKIKIGNTFLDPTLGLAQVTTLLTRIGTGETKTQTGKIEPLRTPIFGKGKGPGFGQSTVADVGFRFLRTKFSPTIGIPMDVLSGKNVAGQPVTPKSAAQEALVPLAFQDVYQAMKDRGIPEGAALSLLSIFGAHIQVHEKIKKAG